MPDGAIVIAWRGDLESDEVESLHAEGFDHAPADHEWIRQLETHSLGWVTARDGNLLVGFVNVAWDGAGHAFLLDTLVTASHRGRGIGTALVTAAVDGARDAGCEWLHVDWDDELRRFYVDACGFEPAEAGLIEL